MIHTLKIANIGPAHSMELAFGERLNLITGDNGLGKSFLLDIIWWTMTRKWPAEVNTKLTAGKVALPTDKKQQATITSSFAARSRPQELESTFNSDSQSWSIPQGRPANPGLVFYAMADGSFAVWDSARNYWKEHDKSAIAPPPAYVFNPSEVWNGLQNDKGDWLCNGLIRDWASWQKENGKAFQILSDVLHVFSPSPEEIIRPGALTRISLTDARDMPTISMGYGQDVALAHASSGMRRIIALAYFLVWSVEEHRKINELKGNTPEKNITFLVDEVESHLHPKWQRRITKSLLSVVTKLLDSARVQIITATHSPLVMASVESVFDDKKDAWFDIDCHDGVVGLVKRDFEKMGDVSNWLTSEAFDLESSRSLEAEQVIQDASILLERDDATDEEFTEAYKKLLQELSPKDEFLYRWRYLSQQKGKLQ